VPEPGAEVDPAAAGGMPGCGAVAIGVK